MLEKIIEIVSNDNKNYEPFINLPFFDNSIKISIDKTGEHNLWDLIDEKKLIYILIKSFFFF